MHDEDWDDRKIAYAREAGEELVRKLNTDTAAGPRDGRYVSQ
jgi:hypothetical protein